MEMNSEALLAETKLDFHHFIYYFNLRNKIPHEVLANFKNKIREEFSENEFCFLDISPLFMIKLHFFFENKRF